MHGDNLKQAKFFNSDLSQVNFTGAIFSDEAWVPRSVALPKPYFYKSADFSNVNLSGAVFDHANLRSFDFANALGERVSFKNADLGDARFSGVSLVNSSMEGAFLSFIRLGSSNFQGLDLLNVVGADRVYVTETNLSGSSMNSDFSNNDWLNVTLDGALLDGASMPRCSHCSFENAHVEGTSFSAVSNVKYSRVIGTPTSWYGQFLVDQHILPSGEYVDFWGANLQGADLSSAGQSRPYGGEIVGIPSKLPANWLIYKGYIVASGSRFCHVDFEICNKTVDLSGINLSHFILDGTRFENTRLDSADLSYTVLNQVDFRNANLASANLSDAYISGSNLAGVNLSSANLRNLATSNIQVFCDSLVECGPPILPTGWKLLGGYLLGPSSKTINANLSGQDLSGMDLTGAGLSGANLSGANLSGANLSGANLSGANLSGANLSGANLAGAVLTSVNLSDARLDDANLNHTDLSGSDLTGTDLTTTSLFGASGTNIQGAIALPTGYKVVNGNLVGVLVLSPALAISGEFRLGETLSVQVGQLVAKNAPSTRIDYKSYHLSWRRDGVAIPESSFSTYTLTPDDVGHGISALAEFSADGYENLVASTQEIEVAPGVLATTSSPRALGRATYASTLTADTGAWDSGVTFTYQWLLDGRPIPGSNTSSHENTISEIGHTVSVRVTGVKNGFSAVAKTSTAVTIKPAQMSSQKILVTGAAKVGKTLVAKSASWAPNCKFKFQWLLDGKPLKGANGATLKLSKTAKGHRVSVLVSATAAGYAPAKQTSQYIQVK